MKEIMLIGEIGLNHLGDLDIAKDLIDMAKKYKWHAVKFQKRTVEKVIPKDMWNIKKETPWGTMKLIDYRKKMEFGLKEYEWIDGYCKKIGIEWFASAWDMESQVFLSQFNTRYNKIGSPMLTYIPLLEYVAKRGKKTFISTGMSTWEDIDKAVKIFESERCPFVLMHCVGLYPCPVYMLNLRMIPKLKERYGCEVGYSGHSEWAMDAQIAAALGARYIEKHITLDRAMFGGDQSASIEQEGLGYIAKRCRHIPSMIGDGKRAISDEELAKAKTLRYWECE